MKEQKKKKKRKLWSEEDIRRILKATNDETWFREVLIDFIKSEDVLIFTKTNVYDFASDYISTLKRYFSLPKNIFTSMVEDAVNEYLDEFWNQCLILLITTLEYFVNLRDQTARTIVEFPILPWTEEIQEDKTDEVTAVILNGLNGIKNDIIQLRKWIDEDINRHSSGEDPEGWVRKSLWPNEVKYASGILSITVDLLKLF